MKVSHRLFKNYSCAVCDYLPFFDSLVNAMLCRVQSVTARFMTVPTAACWSVAMTTWYPIMSFQTLHWNSLTCSSWNALRSNIFIVV